MKICKQVMKRFAPKIVEQYADSEDDNIDTTSDTHSVSNNTDKLSLYICDYSAKSFVIMGDTITHAEALKKLGGTFTQLRTGMQWLFANFRRPSVEKYINNQVIEPFQYDEKTKNEWREKNSKKPSDNSMTKIKLLLNELKSAFDADEEYDGSSILSVIQQLENKYSQGL
jgi:hypothetical protein